LKEEKRMDNDKQKELIMDEIIIEELQEISGGSIFQLPVKPILAGMITPPKVPLIIPVMGLDASASAKK